MLHVKKIKKKIRSEMSLLCHFVYIKNRKKKMKYSWSFCCLEGYRLVLVLCRRPIKKNVKKGCLNAVIVF